MSKDTGGFAFPHPINPIGLGRGMTLRDYFIAQAPAEPWPWFQPDMPPSPTPKWVGESGTVYPSEHAAASAEGECFSDANEVAIRAWIKSFME